MAPLFYAIFCHIVPEMPRMTKKMSDPLEGRSHVNIGRDDWV